MGRGFFGKRGHLRVASTRRYDSPPVSLAAPPNRLTPGEVVDPSCTSQKRVLARALARTPWTRCFRQIEQRVGFLRVVNWHGIPPRYAEQFAHQVDRLLERFDPLDPHELENAVAVGVQRPTVAFTFDDGLANHASVAAPVLEARGVRGIFAVPSDFPSVSRERQPAWFRRHGRTFFDAEHAGPDDLYGLSWDDLRGLVAAGHRICAHSRSHRRIDAADPPQTLEDEVVAAREIMEREIAAPVDGFCWPFGRDPRAIEAERLVRRTYRYALLGGAPPLRGPSDPFRIARTNLEASWPDDVLDLQLSGILDAKLALVRLRRASRD